MTELWLISWVHSSHYHRSELVSERRDWTGPSLLSWNLGCVFFPFCLLPWKNTVGASWTDVKQMLWTSQAPAQRGTKFFPLLITHSKGVCYRGRMRTTTTCMGTNSSINRQRNHSDHNLIWWHRWRHAPPPFPSHSCDHPTWKLAFYSSPQLMPLLLLSCETFLSAFQSWEGIENHGVLSVQRAGIKCWGSPPLSSPSPSNMQILDLAEVAERFP